MEHILIFVRTLVCTYVGMLIFLVLMLLQLSYHFVGNCGVFVYFMCIGMFMRDVSFMYV